MVARIKDLCASRGIKVANLEKELDFGNGSIAKTSEKTEAWRIKKIADFFGVSIDYLLTGESTRVYASPAPASRDALTREEHELLAGFRAASDDRRVDMLNIARAALKKDQYALSERSSTSDESAVA